MTAIGNDTLGTRSTLNVNGKSYDYFSIAKASETIVAAPAVAVDLCQDRRRRNGRHQRIALDNRLGQHHQPGQLVAIDQHLGRLEPQAFYRALHGQQRRLQNVQAVNFFDARHGTRAAQRLGLDFVIQLFASQR